MVHPIVRTHPENGRKALFVSEGFTTRIVGLPEDESRDLLAQLYAHSVLPDEHLPPPLAAPRLGVLGQPLADPPGYRLPEPSAPQAVPHHHPGRRAFLIRSMTMSRNIPFARLAATFGLGISLLAGSLVAPTVAQAEGEIRIAEQFGIVYLLLNVVRDQHLIEKYGKQEGLDIQVDWTQLSGGAAVNDALLSGSIDIAGAGVGPLLTIWDRTRGKQNVKAVASLGNFPYYLVSNNPKVKTIADFTDNDRIAVPAVGVSVQSRFLQYAAAKQWGDKQFNRLDQVHRRRPAPRRHGGADRRRYRADRALFQPAVPGPGPGEPQCACGAQHL